MPSFQSTCLAVLASCALVNADFYIIRKVASNPPICGGGTGCIPVPATVATNVIGVDDFNCDGLGQLGGGPQQWVDPVCPGDGQQGGQPFSAVGNACGKTRATFWFRVQSENPGQLDASTDENFDNIVANCYKQPNCADFGNVRCSTPADYTAEYKCGTLNDSGC